jgi:predicted DNA-binding transcriptional regulator YafY
MRWRRRRRATTGAAEVSEGRAEGDGRRTVDPYQLANINGEWFLFGYCHLRKDIRTFAPARILEVEETGKRFARPPRFSLEKRLRDSFGVITGPGEHRGGDSI